jgi:hypothetical protein
MAKVVLLPVATGLPREEVVNVATRKSLFIYKMEMGDPRTLCSGTLYEVKFGAGPCQRRTPDLRPGA